MSAIEHRHIPKRHAVRAELFHLGNDPARLLLLIVGKMTAHRLAGRQRRDEGFFHALAVFGDERIGAGENLRRGAIVFHHHDGLGLRKSLVKIEQKFHIGATPGVDRLVGIADDEKIFVIIAEHHHEVILQLVDILKLVDHDIFQPLLPFLTDRRIVLENVERKFDEIVVINAEAFFLLVEIAVKNDLVGRCGLVVFLLHLFQRQRQHILVILRFFEQLLDLDHIPRIGKRAVAQRKPALLINEGEHGVDVVVVEHEETLRIADGVAVLPQDGVAEAVEGVDIACVVVASELVDALAHLCRRLVCERDTEDIPRQNPERVHEIGKAVRERPRFAAACASDHPHNALRRRHSCALCSVEIFQKIHRRPSFSTSMIAEIPEPFLEKRSRDILILRKDYIPACAATSAAKSSTRFSRPSPISKRAKRRTLMFSPN